ncbi:hypothetical protein XAXN_07225 [Xanthomonas axonopodis]|uniref:Uncharacterized protein n=1 Tax=Xanthomonas axonopodis TaxID=53413 RepID=A0A0P6VHR4_9XANT|nr:hypothetical protein [Xanthomonas axonopodis]KPL49499.1 hypothetical protein XAXN_07225 [Xanthomonas axonopodis]
MTTNQRYPIGTPGQPWGEPERAAWRARQLQQRSYADDVAQQIVALAEQYQRVQYGTIAHAQRDYLISPIPQPVVAGSATLRLDNGPS